MYYRRGGWSNAYGENIKQVDISNLPNGIYLISIAVGTNLFTQKIIKQ